MWVQRLTVPVTCDASGDATAYSAVVTGHVATIRYVKSNFADTVDFTITAEATGESILAVTNTTVSTTWAPRQPTHSTAGSAVLYAAGGTAVNDYIALASDRVKIIVAQGGNLTTGTFYITVI